MRLVFTLALVGCAATPQHVATPSGPPVLSGRVIGVHGAAKVELWPTTDQHPSTENLAWNGFEVVTKVGGLGIGRPCSPLAMQPVDYFDPPHDQRTIDVGADGAFTVALSAGDYALFAHAAGQSSVVRRVHVAGPTTARLELVASAPLSGVVLDDVGPLRAALCIGSRVAGGCLARTLSDIWGRFSVEGAPLDALTVHVAAPEHVTAEGEVLKRGAHVAFFVRARAGGGVVEGRLKTQHGGVIELVVDGPQHRAEGDESAGPFCPGCDGHALLALGAAPLDDTGHYRVERVPPGRYRALFVETEPDDIGGTHGDGIELLPGVIEVGAGPTRVPDLVATKPHVVALTAHRETGAMPRTEDVGVFAGDDHARYLIGLFDLTHTPSYVAHAGAWLWPSRPQTFYSGSAEWVTRYAPPMRVGAATSIDLEVDRRQQAEHACNSE